MSMPNYCLDRTFGIGHQTMTLDNIKGDPDVANKHSGLVSLNVRVRVPRTVPGVCVLYIDKDFRRCDHLFYLSSRHTTHDI